MPNIVSVTDILHQITVSRERIIAFTKKEPNTASVV